MAFDKPVAVRAIDPRTLEIRFATPFAPALRVFDRYPIAGLGPFAEEGVQAGGDRTFKRNTRYWRKAADGSPLPYLDEIVLAPGRPGMRAFADAAIEATEFEALKKAEQSGHARLFDVGPALDSEALWFSPAPPRADERPWLTSDVFRRAISTAVDRREYCKQVFYGAC